MKQHRDLLADRADADDADRLAAQLAPDKAVLGLARARAFHDLRHVAQARQHHADRQLRNRLIGISGGVGNGDAAFLRGGDIHMVDAREGDVDEFQVFAGADDLARQGHIGDHDDVRVAGALDHDGGIGVFLIGRKAVSGLFELFRIGSKHCVGNGKGFKKNDFHSPGPPFIKFCTGKLSSFIIYFF